MCRPFSKQTMESPLICNKNLDVTMDAITYKLYLCHFNDDICHELCACIFDKDQFTTTAGTSVILQEKDVINVYALVTVSYSHSCEYVLHKSPDIHLTCTNKHKKLFQFKADQCTFTFQRFGASVYTYTLIDAYMAADEDTIRNIMLQLEHVHRGYDKLCSELQKTTRLIEETHRDFFVKRKHAEEHTYTINNMLQVLSKSCKRSKCDALPREVTISI